MSIRLRLQNEMKLYKANNHLNLFITSSKNNPGLLEVLMIGTPGTIYQGGFLYFTVDCNLPYPYSSPKIRIVIENRKGNVLHPNFNEDGGVCLSILGTCANLENEWTALWTIEKIFLGLFEFLNDDWIEKDEYKEDIKIITRYLIHQNNIFISDKLPQIFKEKIEEYKLVHSTIFEENKLILEENRGKKMRSKYGDYLIDF